MNSKPVIALDADGVLLDYHEGYARAWEQAFGQPLAVADPQAYWPWDRYGVPRLEMTERKRLQAAMDEAFWASLRPMPGAVEACEMLHQAGHRLVCVSALDPRFENARQRNFWEQGLPIERVVATGRPGLVSPDALSPKAAALRELSPLAFVDDYLPYFRGVPRESGMHCALVARSPNGSPNHGDGLQWVDSVHEDLLGFAQRWVFGM